MVNDTYIFPLSLGNGESSLIFDDVPTPNSNNPVKSGGIFTELSTHFYLSVDSTDYKVYLYYTDGTQSYQLGDPIDLPLESVVVNGEYNSNTKKVILILQNGSKIEFSIEDLIAGLVPTSRTINNKSLANDITLDSDDISDENKIHKFVTAEEKASWSGKQSAITDNAKLSADLVDDTNSNHKFVTATEKETWNGKQNAIDTTHKLSADLVDDSSTDHKFVSASEKSTWNGKQDAIDATHKLDADLVDDTNADNKFVTAAEKETWNNKQDALTIDSAPTLGSDNPVSSGGVATQLGNIYTKQETDNKFVAKEIPDLTISSAADLWNLKLAIEQGNSYANKLIVLTNDIDMDPNAYIFNGLGDPDHPFSGNIDGQGHTVTINQTYTGTQSGIGGFIRFLAIPDNGTVTIKNIKINGKITITPSDTDSADAHGGLITYTKSGHSNAGACVLNIINCKSNVYFQINSKRVGQTAGFIAWIGHQDGYLAPTTVNIESCIWGGTINAGAAVADAAGFIGNTGLNKTGRNLTINIKNCVAAGKIALNVNWSSNVGLIIGHQKSDHSGATGATTINVTNMVCTATMTSSVTLNADNGFAYFLKENTNYGELNLKDFQYVQHNCGGIEPLALTPDASGYAAPTTTVNVGTKNSSDMINYYLFNFL